MIVLNLKAKVCMSHLLLKPTFDTFSLIEGEVTTFNRFQVDGRIHKDFFDEAFEKEYSTWGEVRDFFFQVIRGKKTPLNFKFILSLAKDQFEAFLTEHDLTYRPAEIQGLYLNFRYDGLALQCITGTSMNTFTMDKSVEKPGTNMSRNSLPVKSLIFKNQTPSTVLSMEGVFLTSWLQFHLFNTLE